MTTFTLNKIRILIAPLSHSDGTLTNPEQLCLDSLRSAAAFAEINSANGAAYAAEPLAHLVDVDCDCQKSEREHLSRELADWHARQVSAVDLSGYFSKTTKGVAAMKRTTTLLATIALLALPVSAHADEKFAVRGYGQQPCTELQGMPQDLTNEVLARLPLPMQLKTLTLFGWILGFASAEDEKATSGHLPGRVSSKFSDSEIVKAVIIACEKSNSKNDPSVRWTISDATMVALSGLIMQSK